MQKDALLIKQTLAGDEQAFHRLIIFYQADINALFMSWVRDPDDAKELVQDVFFKAYCNLASLKQPERFYYWLYHEIVILKLVLNMKYGLCASSLDWQPVRRPLYPRQMGEMGISQA